MRHISKIIRELLPLRQRNASHRHRRDPFAPAEAVLKHATAPAVHLHVERSGGHMGYVSRNLPDRRWLDYALDHYLGQLLGPRSMG